jgi:mannose-6-phosphate isomerase
MITAEKIIHANYPVTTMDEVCASVVEKLRSENPSASRFIEIKDCPWGSYAILDEGKGYKVKKIEVKPGHRLSLQRHSHRSEHWTIVQGKASVIVDSDQTVLETGKYVFIPVRSFHRISNIGIDTLVFIEVQNGYYLGEDDIERLHDDYGR